MADDIQVALAQFLLKTYFLVFYLLYVLKIADIPFNELNSNIIVNHFKKVGEVTRKAGLLKFYEEKYMLNKKTIDDIDVKGKVDRLDRGNVQGQEYFSVVDYKTGSGKKEFNLFPIRSKQTSSVFIIAHF